MKNLDQIRSANALAAARIHGMGLGQEGGNALSGFPMVIKTDGLLAAAAFASETKNDGTPKQKGANLIVKAIAQHLSDERVGICNARATRDLVEELSNGDATLLRRATAEALEFLGYLKRFTA